MYNPCKPGRMISMKKYAVATLVLFAILILCSCGKNGGPTPTADSGSVPTATPTATASASPAPTAPDDTVAASKTFQYFSPRTNGDYLMQLRAKSGNGAMTMTTAVVGGKTVYSDIETENGRLTNFEKEGKTYTILHDMKAYMITDSDVEEGEAVPDNGVFNARNLRGEDMTTGTVDIDGKTYDYEQFTVDDATVRYCFEGGTLKYMLTSKDGKDSRLEVIALMDSVPDNIYDIPAGYENLTK